MLKQRIAQIISFVFISLLVFATGASAGYPDRVISLIVPFDTGGSTDTNARLLAAELEKNLGQRVIVKNISGAAGLVGTKAVADAKPDGYTFGYLPPAVLVMHPHIREVAYSLSDFDAVAVAVSFPYTLFTQKDSFSDFNDMVIKLQAAPGKYFVGTTGVGSMPYFALLGMLTHNKAQTQVVQFKGDADAMQAMMGNRISLYTSTPAIAETFDTAKALVVMDNKRNSFMPDVPCIKEFGQDMNFVHWQAVMAPKGTPKEILEKVSDAIKKASYDTEYKKMLAKIYMAPDYKNPEETTKYILEQNELYKGVTKEVMDAVKAQQQ